MHHTICYSRRSLARSSFLAVGMLLASTFQAAQPISFNYQAKFQDSDGVPLEGAHTLIVGLYEGGTANGADSGTLFYGETAAVTAADGVVNHAIGSGTPTFGSLTQGQFTTADPVFVQVAVDSPGNIVLPRTLLSPVPFAVQAESALNGVPPGHVILHTTGTAPAGFSATGGTLFQPWFYRCRLPFAVGYNGVGSLNGLAYSVGGMVTGSTASNGLYEFNPATDAWRQRADLPTARRNVAVVGVGGYLYAIGGDSGPSGTTYFDSTLRYDPVGNAWSVRQPLASPRSEMMAALANGKIYLFGGTAGAGPVTSAVEYDPGSNSYTPLASLPWPRSRGAVASIDGKIYIAGGFTGDLATTTSLLRYDPSSNTYTELAPMPGDRARCAGGATGGKFHVLGGYSEAGLIIPDHTVYSYDPITNAWSFGPYMQRAHGYFGAAEVGGSLLAVGGIGDSDTFTNVVEILEPTVYHLFSKD